jgi:phosphatidylglycerophosphate synthase
MLDRRALTVLTPLLSVLAQRLHRAGVGANTVTWWAFAIGMASCAAVVWGYFMVALGLMLLGRLADGLDGHVARLTQATDRGAFLDIVLDFLFYAAMPLAFAVHAPSTNALPAAVLLAAFVGTGASFLAFAVQAARLGLSNTRLPQKGFYFLGGLTEGTETILCFALMCLWPQHFATLAYGFAALCVVTIITRVATGLHQLK